MKRTILATLALLMCFSLVACGSKFDIEEYRVTISGAKDELEEWFIPLGNMAKYQASYIKTMGNLGGDAEPEKMFEGAVKWLETESDYLFTDISTGFDSATKKYKEILSIQVEGNEAEKLQEQYYIMYEAFSELYFTVTQPIESTFADNVSNSLGEFTDAYNKLDALLTVQE